MKIHNDNLDYQALVTVYENAKNTFEAIKTKKQEAKAFLKASKKENAATRATIYSAYIQYQQAKLKQKSGKLAVRAAKLGIKGFVQSTIEMQHKEAELPKIAEVIKKATPKKDVGNHADTVEKPTSKHGKTKKATKDADKAAKKGIEKEA